MHFICAISAQKKNAGNRTKHRSLSSSVYYLHGLKKPKIVGTGEIQFRQIIQSNVTSRRSHKSTETTQNYLIIEHLKYENYMFSIVIQKHICYITITATQWFFFPRISEYIMHPFPSKSCKNRNIIRICPWQ